LKTFLYFSKGLSVPHDFIVSVLLIIGPTQRTLLSLVLFDVIKK